MTKTYTYELQVFSETDHFWNNNPSDKDVRTLVGDQLLVNGFVIQNEDDDEADNNSDLILRKFENPSSNSVSTYTFELIIYSEDTESWTNNPPDHLTVTDWVIDALQDGCVFLVNDPTKDFDGNCSLVLRKFEDVT